ncbi:MAG: molybdenum ABC transporter substrate-binding protein [Syntrophus sp. (in: bacteria)]|nr:molybdenum ABC transporter substrate-binding protein [Syntrophus sp. (in: bacteria)]
MEKKTGEMGRRTFLKTAVASTVAATLAPNLLHAGQRQGDSLQVWSCGGLSEAFNIANRNYEKKTGIKISYTGAFAAALGKSLLGGAVTEVFAGRVLKLAKTLREKDKMVYFRPLCFTEYVLITPKGNPANIKSVEDLARPGVPVILPLGASPPGGDAVMAILKKAGIEKAVLKNAIEKETCVIKMMPEIIKGKGYASIVERRLTRMAGFEGKVEVIPIPENLFPPGPLTFTIGVMKHAKNRTLADNYVNFICSDEAQAIFEKQGFIPAVSEKGRALIEKLGVKDA